MLHQSGKALPPNPIPVAAVSAQTPIFTEQEDPVIRCANEVETEGWVRYRNTKLSIEFLHPDTYSVVDSGRTLTLVPNDTDAELQPITFTYLRDTLPHQWTEGMEYASWKVSDRATFAFTTPAMKGDDDLFHWDYLFVRNFPMRGEGSYYSMIRAAVTESKSAFKAAQKAGLADLHSALTPSEKILSTFRFLTIEEVMDHE